MSAMVELIGKLVEVGTPEMVYIGRLIEVNEEEVFLQAESGWVVVPLDHVAYIRESGGE